MALGAAILFAVLGTAAGSAGGGGTTPCPIFAAAAADVRPVLEVTGKAKTNRAPLAVYALGFSATGGFAWLERRVGFDSDDNTWLLHVVNLDNDRILADREYTVKAPTTQALCTRHGTAIARVLDQFQIERHPTPVLEQPDGTRDPVAVEFVAGKRDADRQRIPYRVVLRGSGGEKTLGTVWRIEAESGQPPLGEPTLAGIIRSPLEPRVAVLCRQQMVGTEGAALTMLKVMGGRLDRGWRPAP